MTRFHWTFAIASLSFFVFALDRLVVTTALPVIRADLVADFSDLEWTVNAYTLTFAVLVLTGAALGDRFGRRRVFVLGVGLFTAASVAAALSPTVDVLIAARALQGAGAALFTPVTLTLLTAATAPERRGRVLGAWGGVGGLGAALGPLVGGGLAGSAGWRWIFWLNVPLGALLVTVARGRLAESRGLRRRLDVVGVVLGSSGLLGVVWALVRGNVAGWISLEVLAAAGAGLILLVAFVCWERRTPHAILPVRFFRNRVFATAGLASVLMYAALFGGLFLVAQLLQVGLGASPWVAGLHTLPAAVMPFLLAPLGGALADRVGTRPLLIAGLVLEAASMAWFASAVTPGVGYAPLWPPLVLMGAGSALFFAPLAAITMGAVEPHDQGQASGTLNTVRELAVVLGVAVLGAVFAARGGYSSAGEFVAGFVPSMWLASALAASGALVTITLPGAVPPPDMSSKWRAGSGRRETTTPQISNSPASAHSDGTNEPDEVRVTAIR
jgi:EmrB/QacA subfamily drug resistance transporter